MIKFSIQTISSFCAFIPLFFLILNRLRLRKEFFPLSIYIVLAAFTEVLLLTAGGINLHYMNAFACLCFPLIGWIFIRLINRRHIKIGISLGSLILFGLALINMFFIQGLFFINSYTLMVQVVFVAFLSALLIFQCYNSIKAGQNPLTEPKLLTALIFLFYYGTSFFVFAYAFEAVRFNSDFPIRVWDIHAVINIFFNLCLTYLVWIAVAKRKANV